MSRRGARSCYRFNRGRTEALERKVVEEYPLRLKVNGRELATLVCSPHQLNFLLAGFFRLQGFVESLDDILSLGVCFDYGLAEVRLKGSLPDRLLPTLTSGCGTGIAYNLPERLLKSAGRHANFYDSDSVFCLMKQLNRLTEHYRAHGGIHSAAIGDGDGTLLLHAEDVGRHNTLDRVAGEALFRGIELKDRMLVTSGRVSTEMVAKAARLGIGLIASRTSPTDKAIDLCEQAGITLIGYLRGRTMEIYSHRQQLQIANVRERIAGVTGVILAGGESRRMGSDKSLLPIQGARFIDHVYNRMAALFDEVIIVTNSPSLYHEVPCRKVPDIYYAQGSLAGIHSGLRHANNDHAFVVGCDMPFINPDSVRLICDDLDSSDLVLPNSSKGHEPLHALYSKVCLPAMEQVLEAGKRRIASFFSRVRVKEISATELSKIDPQERSFKNINTPEEYFQLRGQNQGGADSVEMVERRVG